MWKGAWLFSTLKIWAVFFLSVNASKSQRFVLKLGKIPEGIKPENVFIAANINNWNPADSNFRFNQDSLLIIKVQNQKLSFKCTLGNWTQVEKDEKGLDIKNRILEIKQDSLVQIDIEGFVLQNKIEQKKSTASKNVFVVPNAVFCPKLGYAKTLRIYLPPNYNLTPKKYPVVYMHDGQNLFDERTAPFGEWKIDEFMDDWFEKTGKSCIIIGIDHAGENRISEYLADKNKDYPKAEGRKYLSDLVFAIKPFVDTHYRTNPLANFTALAGSSMGGLISAFGYQLYPEVFGHVGIFSPAFWIDTHVFNLPKLRWTKPSMIFLYAGAKESNRLVADLENYERIIERIRPKAIIVKKIEPAGEHSEYWWQIYFEHFMKALPW